MANTQNVTALTTDLNVTPYYDDYDSTKNFYRILFKPGYAVQARELTQMQTMLQEQVSRFGKNIFKDGSIVIPGYPTREIGARSVRYIKLKDTDAAGNIVDIAFWSNLIEYSKQDGNSRIEITGATSNVTSKLIQALDGSQNSSNTKTFYISVPSPGSLAANTFVVGETVYANVNNVTYSAVINDTDPNTFGFGSRYTISSGVLFAKDHFIAFPTQSVIIDRYNPNPTARIGFFITEDVVNSSRDSSLLDPAQEASNYSAPGADRLQLNPVLSAIPITAQVDTLNFVSLETLEEGNQINDATVASEYNIINDAMARRTFDNAGDYVVNGMNVQVVENDDNGVNFGRRPSGNSNLLSVLVSAGTGYVQGYIVGQPSTIELTTVKGQSTANINAQLSVASMGQFVTVNEYVGGWELNKGNQIDLYDTPQRRLALIKGSTGAQTGNKIGTATLLSVEFVSGVQGTVTGRYNIYLADVKLNPGRVFNEVRNLYIPATGTNSLSSADIIPDGNGNYVIQKIPESTLLYYTGSRYTKTVKSISDSTLSDTTFIFNKTDGVDTPVQVGANGQFTISIAAGDERFPYGTTTLTSAEAEKIRVVFNSTTGGGTTTSITLPGTVSTVPIAFGPPTMLVGSASAKFTRLNVGDKIAKFGDTTNIYYVVSIVSDTTLIVDRPFVEQLSAATFVKIYKSGDVIDMTGIGVDSGTSRSIAATPTSLNFDLKETFTTTLYVTVTYALARTSALEIRKSLRTGRYVKIDCASAGTSGPFDLGFSDVYRVRSIRVDTGSFPTSNTSGTDALSRFIIDNGQRDTHYDHATISPKTTLTTTSKILVELDYFEPDFTNRAGYFSIDSYPIQDNDDLFNPESNIRTENLPIFKSSITGQDYDLRNYLDFRPIKRNTADDTTSVAAATINPAATSQFTYPASGLKFPVPSSQISYDFYYYLGRIDIVTVDKDNRFQIITGISSANPQTPVVPPGLMALASLKIVPYPSLSPAYAASIGRPELAVVSKSLTNLRFTMRDIGVLKQRIVNLEYYTSLSILQQAAADLTILGSDADGNVYDRFKNGIFTDNFINNSLSATYDPQFRIVFDKVEKSIRPLYKMESIVYDYQSGTNVKFKNPVVIVDYDEIEYYKQERATTDINVERQSWLFLGTVDLYPSQDIWIDTIIMPDELLDFQSTYVVVYGTQGEADQTVAGYGTTENITPGGAFGVTTNYGTFNANTTPGVIDVLSNTEWNAWQTRVVGYKVYVGNVNSSDGDPTNVQFTTYDEARRYANSINPVGGAGVSIETVYNSERTGTQYWEANSNDVVQTGYKVIDVQIQSYIRPQNITVRCSGMKPFTEMFCFFDGVSMANNSRPLTANQFAYILNSGSYGLPTETVTYLSNNTTSNNGSIPSQASWTGDDAWLDYTGSLITDEAGVLTFQMRIPEGKFRVGQRDVMVTDSRVFIDPATITSAATVPVDITTGGRAVFTASGQSVTKQRSILSTKTVSYHTEAVSQNYNSTQYEYIAAPNPPPASHSCSAYSFLAKSPAGEEGIFLTGLDLFVSRIGRQGFWVEIREMDAGQTITRNAVPYSEVFFNNPADVPISPNGKDNPCHISFPVPVFLYSDTQYALVIHPINANPDLYVWISRLHQDDLNGLGKVVDRRGLGTFYQTNNNTNWDIIQGVDLTVKFYRASFKKDVIATAFLGNRPIEKLFVRNETISFANNIGEIFISGDHITLTSSNAAGLAVGDFAEGATSFVNTTIANVTSGIALSNTGYFDGEIIKFWSSTGAGYKGEGTIDNITNARGILYYYTNGDTSLVHLSGSGGGFVVGDRILCASDLSQSGYLQNIYSISNFRYSAYSFEPSFLTFKQTDITFKMRPTSVGGILGGYVDVDPSTTQYFKTEQAVFSKTNENTLLGGANSNMIQITMSTASNSVSPLVDTQRTQTIIIDNIINNDVTNESSPTHGSLLNKYISKTVTLAEGQDAEDIQVILTAYRPPGTDVKVWLRVLHREDGTPFSDRPWVELYKEGAGDSLYSSLDDMNNFKEFTFLVPRTSVDRVVLSNKTFANGANSINVGDTMVGTTSGKTFTINVAEKGTVFVVSGEGYTDGESVTISNTTHVHCTATIESIGKTAGLTYTDPGTQTGEIIAYTTDEGVPYNTYKYFSIKVGLLASTSAVVPRVGDLRAIALQK